MRSAAHLASAPAPLLLLLLLLLQDAIAWSPLPSRLPTRWDQDVNETSPLSEYPRPTLVRADPLSRHMLNGVWQLDRTAVDLSDPPINRGISGGEDILVPFPIESSLGGVGNVTEHGYSMYYLLADQRVLPPRAPSRTRMLLHFEAVDWETHVWVNGFKQTPLSPQGNHTNSCPGGQCHRGGYDAFYFDITDSVTGPCRGSDSPPGGVACPPGHIEIIVGVFDPTDCDGSQPGQCVQVNGTTNAAASKTGTPTSSGQSPLVNPVGKQSRQANLEPVCCHTRYSSTSGIWGSVWLEGVPSAYIADVVPTPWNNLTGVDVDLSLVATEDSPLSTDGEAIVEVSLFAGPNASSATDVWKTNVSVALSSHFGDNPLQQRVSLALDDSTRVGGGVRVLQAPSSPLQLWSPDNPFLYNMTVALKQLLPSGAAFPIEEVNSYVGMRSISVRAAERAAGDDNASSSYTPPPVPLLNGAPIFFSGPLDQGFWPSGIYTAPTDEALRSDLEATKALGFNSVRKHMKVEPRRWYYHADQLGLLVLQDMPALLKNNGGPVSAAATAQWTEEFASLVRGRRHHPSIVQWTAINEGWGEPAGNATFAALVGAVKTVRGIDQSRLVDGVSGWTRALSPPTPSSSGESATATGDLMDFHDYAPIPAGRVKPEGYAAEVLARPFVLGEEGGYLVVPSPAQQWAPGRCFGHENFTSPPAAFQAQYEALVQSLVKQQQQHSSDNLTLTGAIFTQLTDVEGECNGLLTYAREPKANVSAVARVNAALLLQTTPKV